METIKRKFYELKSNIGFYLEFYLTMFGFFLL